MRGPPHEVDAVFQADVEVGAVNLVGRGLAHVRPFVEADRAIAVGVEACQRGGLVAFRFGQQGGGSDFLSSMTFGPPRVTCSPMT